MMKFIFSFLKKDRQCEAMLDKLLQRLSQCVASSSCESDGGNNAQYSRGNHARNLRDIAYCISLIPMQSDRSVKKLMEALPQYGPALWEDFVYKTFQDNIIGKVMMDKGM